jgi:hypothetical protein
MVGRRVAKTLQGIVCVDSRAYKNTVREQPTNVLINDTLNHKLLHQYTSLKVQHRAPCQRQTAIVVAGG